jgi:hypothetical protein
MLITPQNLYAINGNGKLYFWEINSLEKNQLKRLSLESFTSIAKDNFDNIYLGTTKGSIYKYNEIDNSISIFLKLKKKVSINEIIFNSKNEIFVIIPQGVYDPINDEFWNNFKFLSNGMIVKKRFLFFNRRVKNHFISPQYSFIDSSDRIWMIKSFGEFGGSIQVFDTQNRKELNLKYENLNVDLLFPNSVFEDENKNIYITSGLQHFVNSGEIYKIQNDVVQKLFDSEDQNIDSLSDSFENGVFVGPGAYNESDKKIYYATSNGFYKSSIPIEGRIQNPELIFKPNLLWDREPLAIGLQMSVKQVVFTSDNLLVFLTSNNGIGVFDGKDLRMIN